MSSTKKVQEEDLKKLEDEAYFELCQIIAEAMQYQDVELLDARIASWKNKYKKLLDRPSTSSRSDFKKRVEFLLNQYYSSVTQYILNQLKLKEEKKVENQSKAMRELYRIIQDTNDYDLLKKKIKKWEEKYPVSGFLSMYQKRIELYTRDKNIRENAFKQEEAFSDLVDITKKYATLDELKTMTADWEKKYSINDKYSIDDFIKNQSEVKRFISDEFLISIARDDPKPDNIDKTEIDVVEEYNSSKSFSNLSVQSSSYAALLTISKSPNSINEMFKWVYKNRHIKFNDKYKELILSATYLDYSPTYLNKLKVPNMDISKNSLSYDEYKNINDIKRYAIISYFNLLLPPGKAISNNYFNKHIQTIYAKSEKARVANHIKDESTSISDVIDSGMEISLEEPAEISYITQNALELEEISDEKLPDITTEIPIQESTDTPEIVIDLSNIESALTINLEDKSKADDISTEIVIDKKEEEQTIELPNDKSDLVIEPYPEENISQENEGPANEDDSEESLDYDTIVALSPLFFEKINDYDKQVALVNYIDSATTKYVESEKTKEILLDEAVITKTGET